MIFSGRFDGQELLVDRGDAYSFGPYELLGSISLFRRDELTDRIGIRHAEIGNFSDHQLVLMSYAKWGKSVFQYLEGAWAFVLYDKKESILLLARDPSENSSLFYICQSECLYFSSDNQYFRTCTSLQLEIDTNELIALCNRLVGINPGKTIFKQLFHVLPKEYVEFTKQLQDKRIKYIQSKNQSIQFKYEKDYFIHFRSLMADAIMTRIKGRKSIGVFLSSGLDSSTVFAFLNIGRDTHQKINTYTSVPSYINEDDNIDLVSEEPLVREGLKKISNVDSAFLQCGDAMFNKQIEAIAVHQFFHPIVHSNGFWIEGILKESLKDGVDLMLTGQMGNYSISFSGDIPSLSFSFLKTFKYLWNKVFGRYYYCNEQWKYCIVHDHLLHDFMHSAPHRNAHILGYDFYSSVSTYRKVVFEKLHCFVSTYWSLLSQLHGVCVLDPTADMSIANYLSAIHSKFFYRQRIAKYLLKQSMKGIVYDKILFNPYPKAQTADLGTRLKNENFLSEKVDFLVEKYRYSNFFDVRKLKSVHEALISTKSRGKQHVLGFHLLYMISIMMFYEGYRETGDGRGKV